MEVKVKGKRYRLRKKGNSYLDETEGDGERYTRRDLMYMLILGMIIPIAIVTLIYMVIASIIGIEYELEEVKTKWKKKKN